MDKHGWGHSVSQSHFLITLTFVKNAMENEAVLTRLHCFSSE